MNKGERPLTVCTNETGILEVADALSKWPPIWKAAKGKVVLMTSFEGCRMGFLRAGIEVRRFGKTEASQDDVMQ